MATEHAETGTFGVKTIVPFLPVAKQSTEWAASQFFQKKTLT